MLSLQIRVDLGGMAMKRYSAFLKAPALGNRAFTPLQRCSWCILQLQLTWINSNLNRISRNKSRLCLMVLPTPMNKNDLVKLLDNEMISNSEFKPVKLCLKIDLCIISCPSGGVGKYGYQIF